MTDTAADTAAAEATAFRDALLGETPVPDKPATAPEGSTPPAETPPAAPKRSLEDLLADLDEDKRQVILSEVSAARTEAKNLRTRLKDAEPKVSEYDRLAQASQTDIERAQAAARAAEERASAATQRVVRAELKAALSGVDQADSIIDDLNLSKFLDEDGDVDSAAVTAFKNRVAGFGPRRPAPDRSQGSGAGGSAPANPGQEFGSILHGLLNRG